MGVVVDADPRRGGVLPGRRRRLRFLANRGANGIDGMVSSALGAALANDDRGWLLTGDLALIYDLSGLVRRGGWAST